MILCNISSIACNHHTDIYPLSNIHIHVQTKHARGKLGSYTLDAILARAKQAIEEGVSEIWLSSEDTGAYGIDIGTTIAVLLRKLVEILPDELAGKSSLRFKGLFLYIVGYCWQLVHVECCIKHLWCSSIILYNISSIAYNHHTNILPSFNTQTYIYTYRWFWWSHASRGYDQSSLHIRAFRRCSRDSEPPQGVRISPRACPGEFRGES